MVQIIDAGDGHYVLRREHVTEAPINLEALAQAAYNGYLFPGGGNALWDNVPEEQKVRWRKATLAALNAALPQLSELFENITQLELEYQPVLPGDEEMMEEYRQLEREWSAIPSDPEVMEEACQAERKQDFSWMNSISNEGKFDR